MAAVFNCPSAEVADDSDDIDDVIWHKKMGVAAGGIGAVFDWPNVEVADGAGGMGEVIWCEKIGGAAGGIGTVSNCCSAAVTDGMDVADDTDDYDGSFHPKIGHMCASLYTLHF